MSARMIVPYLVLANAALGDVGVVIELVPDDPGPYKGGESLTVDVWAHNPVAFDLHVWSVQLDFSDADQALVLDPTLTFDLSSSTVPSHFWGDPGLPVPWVANLLEYDCDPCRLQLPAGGSLHIGSIGVQIPHDEGMYRLDALNLDEADLGAGAKLFVGWKFWRAFTGDITGGVHDFVVPPPPIPTVSEWGIVIMTLLLVAAGSILIGRTNYRRRLAAGITATRVSLALTTRVMAQPAPVPSEKLPVAINSGMASSTVQSTSNPQRHE